MKKTNYYWLALIGLLITNACGVGNPNAFQGGPTLDPTSTAVTPPTLTPIATSTPTPIPTASPTLHPLQIEAMRAREYPGSDIVVESVLDPGVNYSRYYVSYSLKD